MELIQEGILNGGDTIEVAWTPRWLLSLAAMTVLRAKREKRMASIKITVTSQEEKDWIIKHGICLGGIRNRANRFVQISRDMLS